MILHYHKLKPFLSPLPETSNQEGTRRQRAAPPCPGGSGSAGWVRWRASGETGRSGERETHRPAHPGPGSASATSQAVTEGERQTGEPPGRIQPSAGPGVQSGETSSQGAWEGERQSPGSTLQENASAPIQGAREGGRRSGRQILQETSQGRQRRPPVWSRDYEMF